MLDSDGWRRATPRAQCERNARDHGSGQQWRSKRLQHVLLNVQRHFSDRADAGESLFPAARHIKALTRTVPRAVFNRAHMGAPLHQPEAASKRPLSTTAAGIGWRGHGGACSTAPTWARLCTTRRATRPRVRLPTLGLRQLAASASEGDGHAFPCNGLSALVSTQAYFRDDMPRATSSGDRGRAGVRACAFSPPRSSRSSRGRRLRSPCLH